MLKNLEGIIFRTVRYGESSLILDIFSPSDGVRSYIVSGIGKKKGRSKSSLVRVGNIVNVVVYDKQGQNISRIREISFDTIYHAIPFDLIKGTLAIFLVEIMRKSIKGTDSNPELYSFVKQKLLELDNRTSSLADFHIHFLIKLAHHLGFGMTNNYDAQHPYFNLEEGFFTDYQGDPRYILNREISSWLQRYFLNSLDCKPDKKIRLQLLTALVDFYRYHIVDFGQLRSLAVLHDLYS